MAFKGKTHDNYISNNEIHNVINSPHLSICRLCNYSCSIPIFSSISRFYVCNYFTILYHLQISSSPQWGEGWGEGDNLRYPLPSSNPPSCGQHHPQDLKCTRLHSSH